MAQKRRKKWKIVLTVTIALLIVMGVVSHLPTGPVKIIISHETTVIDGPLNPDGTVNYVAALNAEYAAGVTRDNNAAVLLLKAVGPSALADQYKTLDELGLAAEDIASDRYFVGWKERASFMEATVIKGADGEPLHLYDVPKNVFAGQVHPDLEAWLEANAGPLRLVEQASHRTRYYMPMVAKSDPPVLIAMDLPSLSWMRAVARALIARAALKCHTGDLDGAWEDVLTAHRLARLMQQGPTLVQQIVAIGIELRAARAGIELATREGLTSKKASERLAQLAALGPVGDVVGCTDRCERFAMLDWIMALSRGGTVRRESCLPYAMRTRRLDWNQILRSYNQWWDRLVQAHKLPVFADWKKDFEAFCGDLELLEDRVENTSSAEIILLRLGGLPLRKALTERAGDLLVARLMPPLSAAHRIQDEVRMAADMEKLAIALAWFRAENGRYPAKLAELAPRYLPTIPTDRFSPDPLIYRATDGGYIVYSVGPNLTDDGGVYDRDAKKDDMAAQAGGRTP